MDKRRRILDEAFHLFGELGYRNTTIKQVAAAAGVAPGSIYTYFADKEDLFRAAVQDGWLRFVHEVRDTISSDATFEAKFLRMLDFGFDLLKRATPLLRGMFADPGRQRLYQQNLDELCQYVEALFEEGRRQGYLDITENRELRRFYIRTNVSGFLLTAALSPPEELDEEIETMRHGLKTGFFEKYGLGVLG
jgi:AcrR family transcriptional regulator